ncbi:hypothetical protein NPIL_326951 [Nephila pilipes]|uniref:Uncharacterized protein n=1 Tax=Nephila pilipes TaxID=299642 RepID=A0A8X6TYX3_NEPPI|nr:hypothetical protein NPIL_326951 [Nephila pilipes]
MTGKSKPFNMKNPHDLLTIRNILSCNIDDEEDVVLDEGDTEEEEDISEREDDSESERVQQETQKLKIMTID